jgi:CBS domain-containing protein
MEPLDELPTLTPQTPLETAVRELMEGTSNRALVLSDHRLAGLLSITDATRLIEAARLTPA